MKKRNIIITVIVCLCLCVTLAAKDKSKVKEYPNAQPEKKELTLEKLFPEKYCSKTKTSCKRPRRKCGT